MNTQADSFAAKPRDPRKNPKKGDTVSVGGDSRQVDSVTCDGMGFVHVGWVRRAGDWGWMRIESWRRWAKKAEVVHVAD